MRQVVGRSGPGTTVARRSAVASAFAVAAAFRSARARGRGLEEQVALAGVLREGCRAVEFRPRFIRPTELLEQIAARARQELVRLERGFRRECVDELEARRGTERHPDRDRTVEL